MKFLVIVFILSLFSLPTAFAEDEPKMVKQKSKIQMFRMKYKAEQRKAEEAKKKAEEEGEEEEDSDENAESDYE